MKNLHRIYVLMVLLYNLKKFLLKIGYLPNDKNVQQRFTYENENNTNLVVGYPHKTNHLEYLNWKFQYSLSSLINYLTLMLYLKSHEIAFSNMPHGLPTRRVGRICYVFLRPQQWSEMFLIMRMKYLFI